jgi:hypothetical protein
MMDLPIDDSERSCPTHHEYFVAKGHDLMTPAECKARPNHNDDHCNICDGGLAYCKRCHGGEVDLETPCAERMAVLLTEFEAREAWDLNLLDQAQVVQRDLEALLARTRDQRDKNETHGRELKHETGVLRAEMRKLTTALDEALGKQGQLEVELAEVRGELPTPDVDPSGLMPPKTPTPLGLIDADTPIGTVLLFANPTATDGDDVLSGELVVVGYCDGVVYFNKDGEVFPGGGAGYPIGYWNTEFASSCTGRKEPK